MTCIPTKTQRAFVTAVAIVVVNVGGGGVANVAVVAAATLFILTTCHYANARPSVPIDPILQCAR